jgi:hypothetical protein
MSLRMEGVKHGLMAKPGQPANDMARSVISYNVDDFVSGPVNSTTVDKADTNPTKQKDRSSEDVKATAGEQGDLSSVSKAPPSGSKEPTPYPRLFIPAGCTLEELRAHLKCRGEEPSPELVSWIKKMEEKDKLKKMEEKAKFVKEMEEKIKLFRKVEEKVETLPLGSACYGGYQKSLTPKDKKFTGHGDTRGKYFVPAGEKMYAPANSHGKFVTPKNEKMPGQGDNKEQLLDGEWLSVSKEEAEEDWTVIL